MLLLGQASKQVLQQQQRRRQYLQWLRKGLQQQQQRMVRCTDVCSCSSQGVGVHLPLQTAVLLHSRWRRTQGWLLLLLQQLWGCLSTAQQSEQGCRTMQLLGLQQQQQEQQLV
jgi:hypothetical protein